jgi:hypothetical protein
VSSKYAARSGTSPTAYRRKNPRRSAAVIGWRSPRLAWSAAVGGGMRASIPTNTRSGAAYTAPAANGIQTSGTPASSKDRPTVFVTPSARMKLAHSPAASASVVRRPSRNPTTSPNTIPSGSPFKNRHAALYGGGTSPNSRSASWAKATSARIAAARRCGGSSATTLMPTNFETV